MNETLGLVLGGVRNKCGGRVKGDRGGRWSFCQTIWGPERLKEESKV